MPHLFVEQLTVIDCAYLDPRRGLVGDSWLVDAELSGSLDAQGMVFDFGDAKRVLKRCIDDTADHKLVVPVNYPELTLRPIGSETELRFTDGNGGLVFHRSPEQALYILEADAVTPEVVARMLAVKTQALMPRNVEQVGIHLRHETTAGSYFHYAHGLKKHAGNCQRIAHGHRSRIEIFEDNARSPNWEQFWANKWRDIYIATSEDCLQSANGRVRLGYQAQQGSFELELDTSRCYILPNESTIERIAQHIAQQLHEYRPASRFRVKAFEGVHKGAISES